MNLTIRILLASVLLHLSVANFGQNPFEQYKDSNIYFISHQQIIENGINYIYTITKLEEVGNMNQTIDFSIIDLSDLNSGITDNWHVYDTENDSTLPKLDELIEKALFINGSFWSFDEGVLVANGNHGYGTLCYTEYEYFDSIAILSSYCRSSNFVELKKMHFFENGFINYIVCCGVDSTDYEDYQDNETEVMNYEYEKLAEFRDTIFVIYDHNWKILGTKSKTESFIFSDLHNNKLNHKDYFPFDGKSQMYINEQLFENWVDENLKFRPKVIFVEITKNEVFVFIYNAEKNKYYHNLNI